MAPLRILVVDDELIGRKLLTTLLEREGDLEVVGVAASGAVLSDRIDRLDPDLVTLELELARGDGSCPLGGLRARRPDLPVIVVDRRRGGGVAARLEALSAGASELVTTPRASEAGGMPIDRLRADILLRIRRLCGRGTSPEGSAPAAVAFATGDQGGHSHTLRPTG